MNLEPTVARGPLAWLARMGPMDRRASWGASDLLVARETPETGAPMVTQGKQGVRGSEETKAARGTLAAQDAEGPRETSGRREARGIKATMEPQEVLV